MVLSVLTANRNNFNVVNWQFSSSMNQPCPISMSKISQYALLAL